MHHFIKSSWQLYMANVLVPYCCVTISNILNKCNFLKLRPSNNNSHLLSHETTIWQDWAGMAALDSMWRQPGLAWGSWRIQFSRWFIHMLESWASSQLEAQLSLWVRELNYSHFLTAGWLASENKHYRAKWRGTALLWSSLARQIASLLLYSAGQGGHNIPLQIKEKVHKLYH